MNLRTLENGMTGLLILIGGLGCTALRQEQAGNEFPDANRAVPVSISLADQPGEIRVPDRGSPEEVVSFAQNLSSAGRCAEAAEVYLDAAKRFESMDGRFESDCRQAAVREYWLAGDSVAAAELLDSIEAEQDLYSRAAEAESIRNLRNLLDSVNPVGNRSASMN